MTNVISRTVNATLRTMGSIFALSFILLHGPNGIPIYVNIDAIHVVLPHGTGSQIELMNGRDLFVQETIEKIQQLIKEKAP